MVLRGKELGAGEADAEAGLVRGETMVMLMPTASMEGMVVVPWLVGRMVRGGRHAGRASLTVEEEAAVVAATVMGRPLRSLVDARTGPMSAAAALAGALG